MGFALIIDVAFIFSHIQNSKTVPACLALMTAMKLLLCSLSSVAFNLLSSYADKADSHISAQEQC